MILVGRGGITKRLCGEPSFKHFYLWLGRIPAEPLGVAFVASWSKTCTATPTNPSRRRA